MGVEIPEFISPRQEVKSYQPYKGNIVVTAYTLQTRAGKTQATRDAIYCGWNTAIDMGIDNPRTRIGAPFHDDFRPEELLHPEDDKTGISRMAALAINNGREALDMAGYLSADKRTLNTDLIDPRRFGVMFGSGYSTAGIATDIERIRLDRGAGRIPPALSLAMFPEQPGSRKAMAIGLKGYAVHNYGACAASGMTLDYAVKAIQNGWADAVSVSGSETVTGTHKDLVNGAFAAFRKATSQRNNQPSSASRPFDAGRDGFVPADAHVEMVLEKEDLAEKRGAKVYAKINRTHSSIDGFRITEADPDEIENLLNTMLYVPRLDKIVLPDAIYPHATGTPLGDRVEMLAYEHVFGNSLREYHIPVTGIKSVINHTLGTSGLANVVMAIIAINEGLIPPIANLENPLADPKDQSNRSFEGMAFVIGKPLEYKPKKVLCLASGFGGNNGAALVEAV